MARSGLHIARASDILSLAVSMTTFDIDIGDATTVNELLLLLPRRMTLMSCRAIYSEATASTGVTAMLALGTAPDAEDLLATQTLENDKAEGSFSEYLRHPLALPANTPIYAVHIGQAATVAGAYRVQLLFVIW